MIEKYTLTNEEKLKKLIFNTNEDSDVIHLAKSTISKGSFAAYYKEEMVGFIVAWKSSFHPFCTYYKIISHPEHGPCTEDLLRALEEDLKETDYPLQTGVHENTSLFHYFQKKNFEIIRKTYLPIIHLPYINNHSEETSNLTIKSVDEISPNQVEQLVILAKRIYEETHLVNPVAEFALSKWQDIIFADDLIQEASYVFLDEKDEILAYSFLHESDQKDTVEQGWKGTRRNSDIEILNVLVAMQIEYGKRNGFQKMEGEFDTTDPYAMEVFHHFQFPKSPAWITFQIPRKGMILS